jgi:hypothetical protein
MKNIFKKSILLVLTAGFLPLNAANQGLSDGWLYENVQPETFLHFFTGGATAVMSKKVSNPEKGAPSVRIYETKADVNKLTQAKETWRSALVNAKGKILIMNEKLINVRGQTRYVIEFQSDTGTEAMMNTAIMGMVVDGKLYKFLYEYPQIVYRNEIGDIRVLYSNVDLKTE